MYTLHVYKLNTRLYNIMQFLWFTFTVYPPTTTHIPVTFQQKPSRP